LTAVHLPSAAVFTAVSVLARNTGENIPSSSFCFY